MLKKFSLAAVLGTALLMAAACGSLGDLGGLGDILGSTGRDDQSDIRGYVTRVDTSARRIDLDVNTVNNLREDRAGSSIYYDQNTVVEYRGQQYSPENLERGDQISVTGVNNGGRYVARRITVLRDVSS